MVRAIWVFFSSERQQMDGVQTGLRCQYFGAPDINPAHRGWWKVLSSLILGSAMAPVRTSIDAILLELRRQGYISRIIGIAGHNLTG